MPSTTVNRQKEWDALPEELKPLFKEVLHMEYFAWKSVDYAKAADDGFTLTIIFWPIYIGPHPSKKEASSLISSIVKKIQSLDKPKDKIIKGIFKLEYETKAIDQLEENEKKKLLLESEKKFLLRQLQFLYDPAVTFKSRKWPKAFGAKPSDFSNLPKMTMHENSLLDQLYKINLSKITSAKLLKRSTGKVTSTKKMLESAASKKSNTITSNMQRKTTQDLSTESAASIANITNRTSSVTNSDAHQGVSTVLMSLNTIIDKEQIQKEQMRLKQLKSRPGAQGDEVVKDIENEGYLNWNVTDFQHLLLEGSHFNDPTMYTFFNAVKHHYKNSIFYSDKYESYTINDWENLVKSENHFMKIRTREFEKIENVCRLMITGTTKVPHYQVVVFVREKSEITIIDCNTNGDLDKKQTEFIKHIIHHMGWVRFEDTIKLLQNKNDGKNDLSESTSWYYNYIKYSKLSQDKLSAAAKKKKLSALSGPFSCLVYLHIISKSEASFRPELINFDDQESPTTIRLNPESMRWDVIKEMKKLLYDYIKTAYFTARIEIQRTGGFIKEAAARVYLTGRLLRLPDAKFVAAIRPTELQTCLCSDSNHKSKFCFYPSCCFRAYHADCYLEFFFEQINKKKKNHYCKYCKDSENVMCSVIDYDNMKVVDITGEAKNAIILYNQFINFAKFDSKHR